MGATTEVQELALGWVIAAINVENLDDVVRAKIGDIRQEQIRTLHFDDALVDTGATILSLPKRFVQQLGLDFVRRRRGITPLGPRMIKQYGAVRLSIQGRDCIVDVAEVSDRTPVLIGQVPLELLDFVVDPRQGKLIPNPAHGGEWTIELC